MSIRVSRRNGRDNRNGFRKRELTFFAISLVMLFSGITSMAEAIDSRQHMSSSPEQPAVSSKERHTESMKPQYGGSLRPMESESSESESGENEADALEDAALDEGMVQMPDDAESEQDAIDASSPDEPSLDTTTSDAEPSSSAQQSAPMQTGVIHHTRYREDPAYRIVHHQASTAREITENGRTRIEWSKCPVCLGRHESAYNESVVDHVNPVLCAACGQRHETDYDEPVYR